jgi:hypothetical protein
MPNGRHSMVQRTTHRSIRNTRRRRAFRILPGSLSSTAMAACTAQGALATSRWAKGPRSMAPTAWVRRSTLSAASSTSSVSSRCWRACSLPPKRPSRRCAAGVAHDALHQARGGLIDAVPGRNRKATCGSRQPTGPSELPPARICAHIHWHIDPLFSVKSYAFTRILTL